MACPFEPSNPLKRPFFNRLIVLLLAIASLFSLQSRVSGDEEYDRFLKALKELGTQKKESAYFEIAFDYLTYLESTDLISDSIKSALTYEKGTLLIASSGFIKNKKERDAVINRGKAMLEKFVAENEYHPSAPAAKNELANLLILTARKKIEDDAGRNSSLVKDAREDYLKAAKIVEATRDDIRDQLKTVPAKPTDERLKKRRSDLEAEFLRARLMMPAIQEEISDTYPAGASRNASLQAAADEYEDVSKDYRSYIAGKMAQMSRGRILAKLEQPKESLALYREIFEQPNSSEFRQLKRMTLELAFQIWLDPENKDNGFVEAVKMAEPIVNSLTPSEERSGPWLSVRLKLAKAFRMYHEYLRDKPEKTKEEVIETTKLLQKANSTARYIASSNSELKREAQKLLVEWGSRVGVDPAADRPPPTSFVEARDRAGEMLSEIELAKRQIAAVKEKLESDPDDQELKTELNQSLQQLVQKPKEAIELLQLAVQYSNDATPVSDLNGVRYRLCFCYYTLKDYTRAALIGEFLLNRFPRESGSKESAAIAMYSYWDLYQASQDTDKEFYAGKVDFLCTEMMKNWPNAEETAEAVRMLIAIAINTGQLDRAVQLLADVPDTSVHKKGIELNTGQAMWGSYQKKNKVATEAGTLAAEQAALIAIRDSAEKLLSSGVPAIKLNELTNGKAKSILALAKIYVEKGDGAQALPLLEQGSMGLINLIKSKHPATSDSRFQIDAYRTALKSYVLSISPSSDSGTISVTMDKAAATMNALKPLVLKMDNGQKLMVSLYYSFATDLKEKMDQISSTAGKKNFSSGLNDFLVGAANSSTDLQMIMWAAGTLSRVADSFNDDGETVEAKKLYSSAISVMKMVDEKKLTVSPEDRLTVLRNQGKAAAGMGDYEKAIGMFTDYLKLKPSTLDVQMDAALAFQRWGDATDDTKLIAKAILGGGEVIDPKTKKNKKVIWGFGRLSQLVSSNAKFKAQFLTARYNLSKCRVIYARISGSDKQLASVKNEIKKTTEKYPDLGGPKMKAKFDALLKQTD